jgi:hypothetical protein
MKPGVPTLADKTTADASASNPRACDAKREALLIDCTAEATAALLEVAAADEEAEH